MLKYLFIYLFFFLLISCSEKKKVDNIIKNDSTKIDTNYSINLKNDTIKNVTGRLKITSKDVKAKFKEIKKKYENELDVIGSEDVFFGDLNGDGSEEALLYFGLSARGGNAMTGSGFVVYKYEDNKLTFLLDYDLKGGIVKSIKEGVIYCIKFDYATGDAGCCPTIKRPFKLIYEGNTIKYIP